MLTGSNTASALMDGWKIEVREPWHGSPQWPNDPMEVNQIGYVATTPTGDGVYPLRVKMRLEGLSNKEIALRRQSARYTLALHMEELIGIVLKNEKEHNESSSTSET